MAEFTLLKLNFEESDLTANAPFSRGTDEANADGDTEAERQSDESGSGRGRLVAALVGLCFCVAVAYLARKRMGTDADEFEADEKFAADA
jgi:hypothetical protein